MGYFVFRPRLGMNRSEFETLSHCLGMTLFDGYKPVGCDLVEHFWQLKAFSHLKLLEKRM
jgi:hypothetical protein